MKEDLVKILYKEFDDIKTPIIHHTIHTHDGFNRFSFDNVSPNVFDSRAYFMEFDVDCREEDYNYLKQLALKIKATEKPFLSFEDMQLSYQERHEMPLIFKRKMSYIMTMSCYIEDAQVYQFVETLRELTKPIRERIFSEQFDEEVEECLSEYNKNNGHK